MRRQLSNSMRILLLVAGVAGVAGCRSAADGADQPDPTDPYIPFGATLAVGGSAFTVRIGSTVTIPVSITRGTGYYGSVDVTVAGLPTGVRADTPRISNPSTTGSVTVTATTNAAGASSASYVVTGRGDGNITIASRTITLTVTP